LDPLGLGAPLGGAAAAGGVGAEQPDASAGGGAGGQAGNGAGGQGAGAAGGAEPDASTSYLQRIPTSTLAFTAGDSCPSGWVRAQQAEGRLLVGAVEADDVGVTAGDPYGDRETRLHGHGYSTSVALPGSGIAAASGCCNDDPGRAGTHPVTGTTSSASDELPRLQQLLCQKQAPPSPEAADGHPFPDGAVLFFALSSCPAGWQPFADAAGRLVVPTPEGGTVGESVGQALASGEVRSHQHGFHATVTIPEQSLLFIADGSNDDFAHKGTYAFGGTSGMADPDLPYIQMLICQAEPQPAVPSGSSVVGDVAPVGTVSFFAQSSCPNGWSRPTSHEGRFLVALPEGGTPLATSGGQPLSPGEDRVHSHALVGVFHLPSKQVAAASGSPGDDDSGKAGDYPFSTDTATASLGMPYLSLLVCTKD